jgi:alkaline phosphatase
MVAYTLYQMDKEADAAGTGFFCMIENTCPDGWGHSGNYDTKVYSMMNEVQCFDEGVAIAVKYVLEHPDTLLVVSADHETGNYKLKTGWEEDFTKISSGGTGHSSQRVPLYAFGAGAENFSAEAINTKYGANTKAGVDQSGRIHEGWIAGALMGELMTGDAFGQPAGYKGLAFNYDGVDEPFGGPLL